MRTCLGASIAVLLLALGCFGGAPRVGVLTPDGSSPFALMDFAQIMPLDPLPEGWYHRVFRRHAPMDLSFAHKDGVAALRMETRDSASMLFRHVDVALDDYPKLEWRWRVEQGVETDTDENTVAGDDHPVRLYLDFVGADGDDRSMEIIWGNRTLGAGDWKHLAFFFGLIEFPHYVANGGAPNLGRWHEEQVDLAELYRTLWGEPSGARLTDIALFCVTDETGAHSVAYVAEVRVARRGDDPRP
jgi:hypothetical protein